MTIGGSFGVQTALPNIYVAYRSINSKKNVRLIGFMNLDTGERNTTEHPLPFDFLSYSSSTHAIISFRPRRRMRCLHTHVFIYLSHLVSALAASDVDDGVGVGELGERLGDNGLTATEGARDGARPTLHRPAEKKRGKRETKSN